MRYPNPIKTYKEYLSPAIITIILLILSVLLHLKWCGTQMVSPESVWQEKLQFHLENHPFKIRLLISYPIFFLHNYFDLPVRELFFTLQYCLSFLLGLAFYRFLRILQFSVKYANLGVLLLIISYPLFCAHIEPVHTWDDILAYLLVTISFTSLISGRLSISAIFFLLSCFAREQSLFFYSIFLFAGFWFNKDKTLLYKITWLAAPLAVYFAFYFSMWEYSYPERLRYIYYNFENPLRARDAIYSFFVSFGFIWFIATTYFIRVYRKPKADIDKFIIWGAALTVPLTIFFIFFFSYPRETRIFFPIFVFLIPLALKEISKLTSSFNPFKWDSKKIMYSMSALILLATGFYLGFLIFPAFEYRNCTETAQQYAGFHIGMILVILEVYLLKYYNFKKKN